MAKTILILGGGVGGQVVANELRRTLSRQHRVTIPTESVASGGA